VFIGVAHLFEAGFFFSDADVQLIKLERMKIIQKGETQCTIRCVFTYFKETSPINCAFLGGNGNTLNSTTTKLKDKRTSIATVRPTVFRPFASFPAPLLSH
jgi:hypothetical protein